MSKEQVMGIVRHVLTFVGGVLVLRGYTTDADYMALSGLISTAVGSIWSIIAKSKE
jgi:hypothetical protein